MIVQNVSAPTTPTDAEIADACDRARAHIVRFGFYKHYLFNTRQFRDGTPPDRCAVDLDGAINVAMHGTPLHLGRDPFTRAVVVAVLARTNAPSLATWCDYKGNGTAKAIALLRDTAGRLRRRTP